MPVMDIERFKAAAHKDFIVFNGPDEQYVAGRLIGADGGIGGTYGAMPELFLAANRFVKEGNIEKSRAIQAAINDIIVALTSCDRHMYAIIKEVLRHQSVNIGGVRSPLRQVTEDDRVVVKDIHAKIERAKEWCA